MTAPSHRDLENRIKMAAETAEAKALRSHIDYAISAYVAYLNKHAPGFSLSITIGNSKPVEGTNVVTLFHPFEHRQH